MKLLRVAACRIDFHHAGRLSQLRPHDPVLHRPQIHGVVFGAVGRRHRVHEDLAQPGRYGPHDQRDARRHRRLHLDQAFADELAREIDVGAILEHGGDLGKPVSRDRSRMVESRNPDQRIFDKVSNTLFRFHG